LTVSYVLIDILAFSTRISSWLSAVWSWSYGSWIYNYLCNQCLSPLTLWVRTRFRRGVLNTTLCDKVCHWPLTCNRSMVFSRALQFPPPIKLTATI